MIYSYLRISSDKQDVAAQRGAIEEYCKSASLTVDVWREIEISSRKSMDDRGITELIGELKAGDALIVSEISRLARNVGEISIICDQILNKKARLICVKERINLIKNGKDMDIQSLVMITMFSLFSQIERSLISIRTKEGLVAARARGAVLGSPAPQNGADAVKKQAVTFAESLRSEFDGLRSMPQREMVERLNQRGIPARNGGPWSLRSVQRALKRLAVA